MKKLFKFSILLVITIIFTNCNENNDKKIEVLNSEQIILNDFIKNKCVGYRDNKNDILKDEYITKYKEDFKKLSDSIKVIENWKGKIVRIDLSNWDSFGQTEINVDIEYDLSEFQKITFKSKRFFSKKNIDSNTETESYKVCSNQLYRSWEFMNGRIRGKYSQSELSRELSLNAKLVKKYSINFTKEEKDYYQSLTDCFKINFDK